MTTKNQSRNGVIVYQTADGGISLRGDIGRETIWATQAQISDVFGVERSVVTKHISNILRDRELDRNSVCAKFAHTADDGKKYQVQFYNLDVILSVGYRVNSKRAVEFRKWATKTLRDHITRGYTINRKRIGQNYDAFMKSVADIQSLLPRGVILDSNAVPELIKEFAGTWVSLDAYDKDKLTPIGTTKKAVKLSGSELTDAIKSLRQQLINSDDASDIFARERTAHSVEGIVGNVMQSVNGASVYPTVEEKSAHLLYFMVKNHPFIDGNKRAGAFAFIWFLRKTGFKKHRNINPSALTAMTLLVAESDPKKKDLMIALITQLLA